MKPLLDLVTHSGFPLPHTYRIVLDGTAWRLDRDGLRLSPSVEAVDCVVELSSGALERLIREPTPATILGLSMARTLRVSHIEYGAELGRWLQKAQVRP